MLSFGRWHRNVPDLVHLAAKALYILPVLSHPCSLLVSVLPDQCEGAWCDRDLGWGSLFNRRGLIRCIVPL